MIKKRLEIARGWVLNFCGRAHHPADMPYQVVVEDVADPPPIHAAKPRSTQQYRVLLEPDPVQTHPPQTDANVYWHDFGPDLSPLAVIVQSMGDELREPARQAYKQLAERNGQVMMIHAPSGAWSDFTPVHVVCQALAERVAELVAEKLAADPPALQTADQAAGPDQAAAPDQAAVPDETAVSDGPTGLKGAALGRGRFIRRLQRAGRLASRLASRLTRVQSTKVSRAIDRLRLLARRRIRQTEATSASFARAVATKLGRFFEQWRRRADGGGPRQSRAARAIVTLSAARLSAALCRWHAASAQPAPTGPTATRLSFRRWLRYRPPPTLAAPVRSLRPGLRRWRSERGRAITHAADVELAQRRPDPARVAAIRLRQTFQRLRLAACVMASHRVRAFAAQFAPTDQLFRDAMLGTDQGLQLPGIAVGFVASARLWATAMSSPELTCECDKVVDGRTWLAHILPSGNTLSKSGRWCANRPRKSGGKHDRCSQRQWCQGTDPVTCKSCQASYCSPRCMERHHHHRGYSIFCGLFNVPEDGALVPAVTAVGKWLLKQPSWSLWAPACDPVTVISEIIGEHALAGYMKGRSAPRDLILPVDFLAAPRLERAGNRACLVHDVQVALGRPFPAPLIMSAIVHLHGALAARDVIECVCMGMLMERRARLHPRDEHLALAAELGEGGVPEFWKAQWVTRKAYALSAVHTDSQDTLRMIRRQVWGDNVAALAKPVDDFFSTHFSTVQPVFQVPLHVADTRRGYGILFTRLTAFIGCETDTANDDHWHYVLASPAFSDIGGEPLPLLERMQALVLGQFPGYPLHAGAYDPARCLAQSGDHEISRQVEGLQTQHRLAARLLRLVEATHDPDNMAVVRMALASYLMYEESEPMTGRMLLGTIRTCLYRHETRAGPFVSSVLSTCVAALSQRCPVGQVFRRWARRAQTCRAGRLSPVRAASHDYWFDCIVGIETLYPELAGTDTAKFWFVARLLGDMNAVRAAARKDTADGHATRVWRHVRHDRM